jgi:hypothetical protein
LATPHVTGDQAAAVEKTRDDHHPSDDMPAFILGTALEHCVPAAVTCHPLSGCDTGPLAAEFALAPPVPTNDVPKAWLDVAIAFVNTGEGRRRQTKEPQRTNVTRPPSFY